MRKLVSLVLIVVLASGAVLVPPPSAAEANGGAEKAVIGLAAFAVGVLVATIFTPKQTQAAVVVYPPPQPVVSGPATYPSPPPSVPPATGTAPAPAQMVYPAVIRGGLTVGNSAGSPIDVFVNGQLVRAAMPHGEVTTLAIPGSGTVLARLPEGKFAQKNFWPGQREAIVFSQYDFPQ